VPTRCVTVNYIVVGLRGNERDREVVGGVYMLKLASCISHSSIQHYEHQISSSNTYTTWSDEGQSTIDSGINRSGRTQILLNQRTPPRSLRHRILLDFSRTDK